MTTMFTLPGRGGSSFNFGMSARVNPARPEHATEDDLSLCTCGECRAIDAEEAEYEARKRFEDGTYDDRSNEG